MSRGRGSYRTDLRVPVGINQSENKTNEFDGSRELAQVADLITVLIDQYCNSVDLNHPAPLVHLTFHRIEIFKTDLSWTDIWG